MLRIFLGAITLSALALATIGALALYAAPRAFRSEVAQLAPHDGPTAYLVYALDTDTLRRTELERASERMAQALRSTAGGATR